MKHETPIIKELGLKLVPITLKKEPPPADLKKRLRKIPSVKKLLRACAECGSRMGDNDTGLTSNGDCKNCPLRLRAKKLDTKREFFNQPFKSQKRRRA